MKLARKCAQYLNDSYEKGKRKMEHKQQLKLLFRYSMEKLKTLIMEL